jgi:hypothetical protein
LQKCSTWLHLQEYLISGNIRLRAANFCCQTKLCPACAAVTAARNASRITDKTREILLAHENDVIPGMLTFTLEDQQSLGQALKTLLNGKHRRNAWEAIRGAIIRVEIKRGKNSGLWHPHAHALILRDRLGLLDLAEMQADWRRWVGRGNIDFKILTSGKRLIANDGLYDAPTDELLRNDVREVSKYIAKHGEVTPSDLVHIYRTVGIKRLGFTWGIFFGVKLPDKPEGDMTQEVGPYRDIIANWINGRYEVVNVREQPGTQPVAA